MLTIRLQRVGKTKHALYRLIVSEKGRDTQDKYLENLGSFNPHAKEGGFLPKADRIKHWISQGAQTSNTVNNLLLKSGVIFGAKKKSVFLSKKRQAKLAEKKSAKGGSASDGKTEPAPAAAPAAQS